MSDQPEKKPPESASSPETGKPDAPVEPSAKPEAPATEAAKADAKPEAPATEAAKADEKPEAPAPDAEKAPEKAQDEAPAMTEKPASEAGSEAPAKAPDPAAEGAKAEVPLSAEKRREQLEAEIRKRLEQELTERHGEKVVSMASRPALAPTGSKLGAPPAKEKPKKTGFAKKPRREMTEEEKQAARIRAGKADIEHQLRKKSMIAYVLVSLICFGGFGLWYAFRNHHQKAGGQQNNAPMPELNDQWYDSHGNPVENPLAHPKQGAAVEPEKADPQLGSRRFQQLMETVERRESAGDYLGAIDEIKFFSTSHPDEAGRANKAIHQIRKEHPNETGNGPFWELIKDDVFSLMRSKQKDDYIQAAKMLLDFKKKHKEEAPVATYWYTKISADYLTQFQEALPVAEKQPKRHKDEEDEYGDWGGGPITQPEPAAAPEPETKTQDTGKALDFDNAWGN